MVLTTHFLDEADALGDRVAILHKGRLQAVGSSHELKRKNATAYRLTLGRRTDGASADELLALARRHAEGATVESETLDEVRCEEGKRLSRVSGAAHVCAAEVVRGDVVWV
jgi:ATP-binding cassette subfamily A (ABC1) protein 3